MFALLLSSSRKISSDMIKASSTGAFTFVGNSSICLCKRMPHLQKTINNKAQWKHDILMDGANI